jgi:hypothetical protein
MLEMEDSQETGMAPCCLESKVHSSTADQGVEDDSARGQGHEGKDDSARGQGGHRGEDDSARGQTECAQEADSLTRCWLESKDDSSRS